MLTEAIQRKPLRAAWAKVRAAAWPCLIAGWRFWPLAHAFTYSIVPMHLRVLWVDALEIAWVAILTTCIARAKGDGDDAASEVDRVSESSESDESASAQSFIGTVVSTSASGGATPNMEGVEEEVVVSAR